MREFVSGSTSPVSKLGRINLVLEAIADEVAEELNDHMNSDDYDHDKWMVYWAWVSHVIAWIGHGETDRLPEPLQPFARRILGEAEPDGQLALESGSLDSIIEAEMTA